MNSFSLNYPRVMHVLYPAVQSEKSIFLSLVAPAVRCRWAWCDITMFTHLSVLRMLGCSRSYHRDTFCLSTVFHICVILGVRIPSEWQLCQCGIQVSTSETWKPTNQRSFEENPWVPITDLFAVSQALTLFANPVMIRAVLLGRCKELDQVTSTHYF